jgi:hypothetical protein
MMNRQLGHREIRHSHMPAKVMSAVGQHKYEVGQVGSVSFRGKWCK